MADRPDPEDALRIDIDPAAARRRLAAFHEQGAARRDARRHGLARRICAIVCLASALKMVIVAATSDAYQLPAAAMAVLAAASAVACWYAARGHRG